LAYTHRQYVAVFKFVIEKVHQSIMSVLGHIEFKKELKKNIQQYALLFSTHINNSVNTLIKIL
jgi:hypothetical protein